MRELLHTNVFKCCRLHPPALAPAAGRRDGDATYISDPKASAGWGSTLFCTTGLEPLARMTPYPSLTKKDLRRFAWHPVATITPLRILIAKNSASAKA